MSADDAAADVPEKERREPVLVAVEIKVLVVQIGLKPEDVAIVGDADSEGSARGVQEGGNGFLSRCGRSTTSLLSSRIPRIRSPRVPFGCGRPCL